MKLLHPIVPEEGKDAVRVVVVTQGNCLLEIRSSLHLATSYLDIVCSQPKSFTLLRISPAEEGRRSSIAAALAKIENHDVDLVIASDLWHLSRQASSALDFVSRCVNNGVRVLAFEDDFDSEDTGWQDHLAEAYAPISEQDVPATEGGQP